MNTTTIAFPGQLWPIIGLCVFVILFAMIYGALKHIRMLSPQLSRILSVCVTILCMISMDRLFEPSKVRDWGSPPREIPLILIPYGALGLCLLLMGLVLGFAKLLGYSKRHRCERKMPSRDPLSGHRGQTSPKPKKVQSRTSKDRREK